MNGDTPTVRAATPADARGIAAVHVTAWRETYAGLLPDSLLDALGVPERTARWEAMLQAIADGESGAAIVACKGQRLCGFLSVGPQRDASLRSQGFTGEILALYVLAQDQRQGIGQGLMRAGARALQAGGHAAAALWVLDRNDKARRFYGKLGGREVGRQQEERPGLVPHDVAYGWPVAALLGDPSC